MHELVNTNEGTDFIKQIHLIETFKGTGFLSRYLSWERLVISQLFQSQNSFLPTLGLDPAVKQPGKSEGTKIKYFSFTIDIY